MTSRAHPAGAREPSATSYTATSASTASGSRIPCNNTRCVSPTGGGCLYQAGTNYGVYYWGGRDACDTTQCIPQLRHPSAHQRGLQRVDARFTSPHLARWRGAAATGVAHAGSSDVLGGYRDQSESRQECRPARNLSDVRRGERRSRLAELSHAHDCGEWIGRRTHAPAGRCTQASTAGRQYRNRLEGQRIRSTLRRAATDSVLGQGLASTERETNLRIARARA